MNRARKHTLSGAIAKTAFGRMHAALAPTVVVVSEQPYTPRAARRHSRTENGAVVNVSKARQAPGLNEPYRTPTDAA